MQYRAEIDGLRAVAVIPVVLFHANITSFSGGYVGVDVFFVISGYLIAGLILEDIENSRFSIASFYERRIRRIFPALALTLLVSWPLATWLFMPPEFASFSGSVVSTLAFVSNIYFWSQSGYFAAPAETKPLLHLWSLAVEEQFYLVFPLVFLLLVRYIPARLKIAVIALLLFSLALSIVGVAMRPGAAFFWAPTRAWELIVGVILALPVVPRIRHSIANEFAIAVGLALILWAVFTFSPATPFPGANALFPCVGAALIIHSRPCIRGGGGWLLGTKPMVLVGLISYPLYLFHWPLLVFAHYYYVSPLPFTWTLATIATSVVAATMVWWFVERPIRGRTAFPTRRRLFEAVAAFTLLLGIAGTWGAASGGLPARYPGYVAYLYRDQLPEFNVRTCFLMSDQAPSAWKEQECLLSNRHRPITLLLGDSFSAHLVPGIKANLQLLGDDFLQYSAASCAPIADAESSWRPNCREWTQQALAAIKKYHVGRVVISAQWGGEREHYHAFFSGLRNTIAAIEASGAHVTVIGQSPVFNFWNVFDLQYRLNLHGRSFTNYRTFLKWGEGVNDDLRRNLPGVELIDPMPFLCSRESCPVTENGVPLYIDGGHFSLEGSSRFIRAIAARLNGTPHNGQATSR